MAEAPKPAPAQPPVRDSGPVEGDRGNREVPPTNPAAPEEEGAAPTEEDRLGALQAERDELFDRLQRLAAEFDNYRKRSAREQAEQSTRANEGLVKELLPILDDLGRALEAAADHEEAAQRPVRDSGPVEGARGNREVPSTEHDRLSQLEQGVRLVHRSLEALLERQGLAEIETDGKFDPHVHEALLTQPSELPEGDVLQVIQKGYSLADRVLRPARVVVSAGPPEEPQS